MTHDASTTDSCEILFKYLAYYVLHAYYYLNNCNWCKGTSINGTSRRIIHDAHATSKAKSS